MAHGQIGINGQAVRVVMVSDQEKEHVRIKYVLDNHAQVHLSKLNHVQRQIWVVLHLRKVLIFL